MERLRNNSVVPLVGPSGVGKNSFIHAGVIPRLREGASYRVLHMRPGPGPCFVLPCGGKSAWLEDDQLASLSARMGSFVCWLQHVSKFPKASCRHPRSPANHQHPWRAGNDSQPVNHSIPEDRASKSGERGGSPNAARCHRSC